MVRASFFTFPWKWTREWPYFDIPVGPKVDYMLLKREGEIVKQLRSSSGQEMFQRIRDANSYKVCDVEHEVPLAAVPAMLRHEENL